MRLREDGYPGGWRDRLLRKLYKSCRPRAWRHSQHLWPYVKIERDESGAIAAFRYKGRPARLVALADALPRSPAPFHVVLSGPSVAAIDYSRLRLGPVMGVNGSIRLQDRHAQRFDYYCLIDRNFVCRPSAPLRRIVGEAERTIFVTPDVLRYIMQTVEPAALLARFCVVELLHGKAYRPAPTAAEVREMARQGADIHPFDEGRDLGFSFDPALGFFDADTVAYAALQILAGLGVPAVYFHGLDIRNASAPRFYEADADQAPSRLQRHFDDMIEPSFRLAMPLLAGRGIAVWNLSPDSALSPHPVPFKDWRDLLEGPATPSGGVCSDDDPPGNGADDHTNCVKR